RTWSMDISLRWDCMHAGKTGCWRLPLVVKRSPQKTYHYHMVPWAHWHHSKRGFFSLTLWCSSAPGRPVNAFLILAPVGTGPGNRHLDGHTLNRVLPDSQPLQFHVLLR